MQRVRAFFLGGTIAMGATGPGAGLEPRLGSAQLLSTLSLPEGVTVDAVDVARLDSSALTLRTCLDALARADAAVRSGEADGVVVVQGTDTLEETAYLWDLLWPHPHPFVVTGAMRPPEAAGADGPANLLAAVVVAASVDATDQGVLVVLADEVHAARHVTKRHSTSPSAFASPDLGPLGRLEEGRAVLLARVPRRGTLAIPTRAPSVGLLRASLDDDPAHYRAAAEVAEGLVVEGFGAGQLSPESAEVLLEVAARTPVVLTSRAGAGPVHARTYAGRGSGSRLLAHGLVPGGRLSGLQARTLLRVLLGAEPQPDRESVAAVFRQHGG